MKPTRSRDDAVVDLLDVLLGDGVVLDADVVVTVADVPLVGIKLRAAVGGTTTMTDHATLASFDRRVRDAGDRRSVDGDSVEGPSAGRRRDGPVDSGE